MSTIRCWPPSAAVLPALRETTGESVQLYRREGTSRVCVAALEPAAGLRDTVPVGARLPMTAGSGAKVLLAYSDAATRKAVLPTAKFTDRDAGRSAPARLGAKRGRARARGSERVGAGARRPRCRHRRDLGVGPDRPHGPASRGALGRRSTVRGRRTHPTPLHASTSILRSGRKNGRSQSSPLSAALKHTTESDRRRADGLTD